MKEFATATVHGAEHTAVFILALFVMFLTGKIVWWLWCGRTRRPIVLVSYRPNQKVGR